jgi:hypothetical protein
MLIEATDAHFAALIAGESPDGLAVAEGGVEAPEVLAMLRGLSAEVGQSFQPNAWLIVEDGEVVGSAHPGECRDPDPIRAVRGWSVEAHPGSALLASASEPFHLGPGIRRDERTWI